MTLAFVKISVYLSAVAQKQFPISQVLPPGETGEIAFRRGADPVFFLGYWDNPDATRDKFKGDWACSGDLGAKDNDGYFWFKGRKDDVIISAGCSRVPA